MSEPSDNGLVDDPDLRFGNYALLRHLGAGGMAEVDLASLEGPGGVAKLVALKRIKPKFVDNSVYVKMFLDEARIAAALQHPNIIQVHDVGMLGKEPFIAMEYVPGKNLAQVLVAATERNAHLPLEFAVGTIASVLRGLHHAHEMTSWEGEPLRIVHRDVSPDNIFVSYEGDVKLMDFGLAKARNRSTHTQVGIIKGTVGYMAPEQFKGSDIDLRLDVFAAGVVFWEMITGHRLLESATTREAWTELNEKPVPSPSKFRKDSSVALEAIIRRALNKDPDQRYQTALAFLIDLERVAEQERLFTSATRRTATMDALFPGRRGRSVNEGTGGLERPVTKSIKRTQGLERQVQPLTDWIKAEPLTALGVMALLTALVFLLGLVVVVDGNDTKKSTVTNTTPHNPPPHKADPPPKRNKKNKPRRKGGR